jgi:hypothetical protein
MGAPHSALANWPTRKMSFYEGFIAFSDQPYSQFNIIFHYAIVERSKKIEPFYLVILQE